MEKIHMGKELYADIIIDISHEALDRVFQYRVPFSLVSEIGPGVRVRVPFGAGDREREGYVIALKDKPEYDPHKIKEIRSVVEDSRTVESQLIQTAAFLRRRYGSSMIQALKTVMPVKTQVRHRETTSVILTMDKDDAKALLEEWIRKRRTARVRLLKELLEHGGVLSKEEAVRDCRFPLRELRRLEEAGILRLETKVAYRILLPGQAFGKRKPATV